MWGHEVDPMGWGPPWITITTYGEKVLETNKTIPHDPDGYLNNFKETVPAADNLIQVYLAESLQTFNHNNLFASMVMLGGASEAAFEVLWSTLKSKYNRKERFEKLDNKPLKTKFDEVIKELELIKNKLPKEIKENIDTNIKGIFTLIRTQRNDFGHPTGKYINRFQMFAYLQLFTGYCKALYDLNSYFENELVNDDQRRAAE
jgi:hypothetical protein